MLHKNGDSSYDFGGVFGYSLRSLEQRKYPRVMCVCVASDKANAQVLNHQQCGRFTQLLFQQNALVFIKSTRYYNLYFLSLYS
jgi:hypothetical protein